MTASQITMSSAQLLRNARESCGIDIDDSSVAEPLDRLVHSLNGEAMLNARGAQMMERRLMRLLCNRLRMQRDFAEHPEISRQVLGPVLMVTGGPRTGSTKLQKMLAAGGDFKYLPFWHVHNPALWSGKREEDCAPRVADAEAYIEWMNEYAPEAQLNHGYGTFEPEEESLLIEHHIGFIFPYVLANIPSFLAWWVSQDFTPQACFLRQGLQYLQWQFHDGDRRPWLLKAPMYAGREEVLEKVFPGMTFVITHRDPQKTVPSTARLVNGYREGFSDVDYRKSLGAYAINSIRDGARLNVAVRDLRPDLRFHDVAFSRLADDSEGVVESVYAHAGMKLSDAARVRLRQWEAAHGAEAGKTSRYAPSDFGLTSQMIARELQEYVEQFGRYF